MSGYRGERVGRRLAASALFLFGAHGAACRRAPPTAAVSMSRPVPLTESGALDLFPALSPDGRSLAYATARSGRFEIHVRPVDGAGPDVAVTNDGKQNVEPAWSPDGATLAYHSKERGGIWLVPVAGGAPRPLADFGSSPAFSPDGTKVAFQAQSLTDVAATSVAAVPPSTIWVVPARGGPSRDVTQRGEPVGGHGAPVFSANGARIFFVSSDPRLTRSELWSVRLDREEKPVRLYVGERFYEPVAAPDGKTLYFGGRADASRFAILALRLAPDGRNVEGPPRAVSEPGAAVPRHLSISRDGTALVWSEVTTEGALWSIAVTPAGEAAGEPRRLTPADGRYTWPVFSPDGTRIAFGRALPGENTDVWVMDRDGGGFTRLTDDPAADFVQDWFPDGRRFFLVSDRGKVLRIYALDVAARAWTPLPLEAEEMGLPRLSPDGREVVFQSRRGGETLNLWRTNVDGRRPTQITFDRELFGFPCWSPDGRTIAGQIKRGDDMHVALVPAAGGTPAQLTSARGLSWPFSFSPDGSRVLFAGFRGSAWNVYWVGVSDRVERRVTSYERLSEYVRYPAWSPDGREIVFERAETTGRLLLGRLSG